VLPLHPNKTQKAKQAPAPKPITLPSIRSEVEDTTGKKDDSMMKKNEEKESGVQRQTGWKIPNEGEKRLGHDQTDSLSSPSLSSHPIQSPPSLRGLLLHFSSSLSASPPSTSSSYSSATHSTSTFPHPQSFHPFFFPFFFSLFYSFSFPLSSLFHPSFIPSFFLFFFLHTLLFVIYFYLYFHLTFIQTISTFRITLQIRILL
jgi:hypothetical protein